MGSLSRPIFSGSNKTGDDNDGDLNTRLHCHCGEAISTIVILCTRRTICAIVQIRNRATAYDVESLSRQLAVLGHPLRLRLLALLLAVEEPLCVCEISDGLQIPSYQASRNLKALAEEHCVSSQRKGLWIYYSAVVTPAIRALASLLSPAVSDLQRVEQRLKMREGGVCVVGPGGGAA